MPPKATHRPRIGSNTHTARIHLQSVADDCSRKTALSTAHIPRRNRELTLQCIDLLHQRFPGRPWVDRVAAELLRDDAFLQQHWGQD